MIRDGYVTFLTWSPLLPHDKLLAEACEPLGRAKRLPGQVMPNFCTFGQEMPLWKRFYYGSMSVKISGRGQIMAFLAPI